MADFYDPFNKEIQIALESVGRLEVPPEESTEICEKCGRTMVFKYGRFGKFLACPGYPECKNAKPIRKNLGIKCPKCGIGEVTERKSKKGRLFYGCDKYPNCDFVSWERPYSTPCPKCGSICIIKGNKGKDKEVICQKEGCGYTLTLAEPGETN